MNNTTKYRINSSGVIYEMIDGEVIIVNLDKGHYYSLSTTGALIWDCLVQGLDTQETIKLISGQYEEADTNLREAVFRFLAELENEEIIVPDQTGEKANTAPSAVPSPKEEVTKRKFEAPVIEKYTDMEELLLLDPIHEVDETGWPNVTPGVPQDRE